MKTKFKIFMLKLKRIFFKIFIPCLVCLIVLCSSIFVVSAEETEKYSIPVGVSLFDEFTLYRMSNKGGIDYAVYELYDTPGSDFLTYPTALCFPFYTTKLTQPSMDTQLTVGIGDNELYEESEGQRLVHYFEQGKFYKFTFILRLNNRPSNENISNHFGFEVFFSNGIVIPSLLEFKGAYYEPSIAGYNKDGVKVTSESYISGEYEYPINDNLTAYSVAHFEINDNYANVDYYRLTFTIYYSKVTSPSLSLQFRGYMREIKTTDGEVADFIVNGGHAEPPYPDFEGNEQVDNAISSEEELLDATAGYREEGKELLDTFTDITSSGPVNRGLYFYSIIIDALRFNPTLFNILLFSLTIGVVGFILSIPTILKGGKK